MNKEMFIKELMIQTKYEEDVCIIVNDVLENHFIIGKNSKEKIINSLKEKLSLNEKEAEKIYEISMNIISKALKDKIKNPFKSQD